MASKKPCPKTLDLFADDPASVVVQCAPPVRSAPVVDNSKNGFSTPEQLAAYATAMYGEMKTEVALCQFIRGLIVAGRRSDIETDGRTDYRKVNRLANGLLGRPESDKPEPKAAEWQAAYIALADKVGLSMEPEE